MNKEIKNMNFQRKLYDTWHRCKTKRIQADTVLVTKLIIIVTLAFDSSTFRVKTSEMLQKHSPAF